MALCDNKAERRVMSGLPKSPSVLTYYIWVVPGGITLPEDIPLCRDELWTKEAVRHGHQTFNAARNFETGEPYMQRIEDLNRLGFWWLR